MTALFERALAAIRVFLGWNDPSENHLHAAHGWLLAPAHDVRARAAAQRLEGTSYDGRRR